MTGSFRVHWTRGWRPRLPLRWPRPPTPRSDGRPVHRAGGDRCAGDGRLWPHHRPSPGRVGGRIPGRYRVDPAGGRLYRSAAVVWVCSAHRAGARSIVQVGLRRVRRRPQPHRTGVAALPAGRQCAIRRAGLQGDDRRAAGGYRRRRLCHRRRGQARIGGGRVHLESLGRTRSRGAGQALRRADRRIDRRCLDADGDRRLPATCRPRIPGRCNAFPGREVR